MLHSAAGMIRKRSTKPSGVCGSTQVNVDEKEHESNELLLGEGDDRCYFSISLHLSLNGTEGRSETLKETL